MISIKFERENETALMPTFAYDGMFEAGLDFYSNEDTFIYPNGDKLVSLGVKWEPILDDLKKVLVPIENNILTVDLSNLFKIEMKLEPRSGLSCKKGIEVGAGVIDSTYRNVIKVHLYNNGFENFDITKGMAICQGVVHLIPKFSIYEGIVNNNTQRGLKGFGSSG